MATLKTGWMKKLINGVSEKIFAISHVKSVYYNYANDVTLKDKLDEIDDNMGKTCNTFFITNEFNLDDLLNYPSTISIYNGWAYDAGALKYSLVKPPFGSGFGLLFTSPSTWLALNIDNKTYHISNDNGKTWAKVG